MDFHIALVPKLMNLSRFSGHGWEDGQTLKERMSEVKAKLKRRQYDGEFRRNAVALVKSSGRPLKEIAAELGVSYWNLRDWSKENRKGAVPAASAAEIQREMSRLRRENEKLQARCDVLKKALGILAEPKDNATHA